jgi:hypothetical protein
MICTILEGLLVPSCLHKRKGAAVSIGANLADPDAAPLLKRIMGWFTAGKSAKGVNMQNVGCKP